MGWILIPLLFAAVWLLWFARDRSGGSVRISDVDIIPEHMRSAISRLDDIMDEEERNPDFDADAAIDNLLGINHEEQA